MKTFEVRFHQKTTANSSRTDVDWLYWNINADAVAEVISFDFGEKVLSFRPSYDVRHWSKVSSSQPISS
ncbi:unnamed protein product [Protopolystoma xenopodis]|uniref:Uncharacterized protein n=1 Tax=Protopolystoma xenopodis TaxID=117903 RepID=A0A448X603_9PLAT|nr:unnamed protein product [Protopolystoma xenopodis]